MKLTRWKGRAFGVAALALSLGACDFITAIDRNPNLVPTASLDQLFTAAQVNAFFQAENQVARITSMWTQQVAGTDRQFSALDQYQLVESDADGEFGSVYVGGGLLDLRRAQDIATTDNRIVYRGILKVYEAWMIGQAASIWGAIPYSEAVNPDITAPKLDPQEQVYAAVQALLDGAIADLQSGQGAGPGDIDMVYGGDAAKWTAAANTLKARYYIHWAEAQRAGNPAAQAACGGDCIAKAVAAANAGISDPANDWRTVHTTTPTETNPWYQFLTDRSGYVSAGARGVDLLKERDDPRLSILYTKDASGGYSGSLPGENNTDVSLPNITETTSLPVATCAETQFVAAEALYYQGNAAGAQSELQQGVGCEQTRLDVTIPVNTTLTGESLLEEIITQKYFADFLSVENYNDYKRTCYPRLYAANGVDPSKMPGRLYYGTGERSTNSNLRDLPPDRQPARNTNDPGTCTNSIPVS